MVLPASGFDGAGASIMRNFACLFRTTGLGVIVMMLCVGAAVCAELSTPVHKPVAVVLVLRDGQRINGVVTAFNEEGFTLEDDEGSAHEVSWPALRAKQVYSLHQMLLKPGSGPKWMAVGHLLRTLPDGWKWSNFAFGRAAKLDPSLKSRVRELVRQKPPRRNADGTAKSYVEHDTRGKRPATTSPSPPVGLTSGNALGGGGLTGAAPPWPGLTRDDHDRAIEQAKAFAERAHLQVSGRLAFYETRYFLFFTDLNRDEALKWQALLDRMYDRMCEMFAVKRGTNIWRGKASVYVFRSDDDYRKFEQTLFNTPAENTAGRCHANSRGDVTIAFYRQLDEKTFANILVHEATHGFLHRYRTAVHVQSWANEGLAEWIAADLVPQSQTPKARRSRANQMLRQWRNLGPDFFTTPQIAGDQYGIAYTFTAFLISADRSGYVKFINGCKDGLDSVRSLEKAYGVPVEDIVAAYGRSMGVGHLSIAP